MTTPSISLNSYSTLWTESTVSSILVQGTNGLLVLVSLLLPGKRVHQLFVQGTDGLLVLVSLLILNLLTLAEPTNYSLVGHALVLEGSHPH